MFPASISSIYSESNLIKMSNEFSSPKTFFFPIYIHYSLTLCYLYSEMCPTLYIYFPLSKEMKLLLLLLLLFIHLNVF